MQVLKNSSIAVGIEWTLHDSIAEAKKAAAGKKKVLVVRKIISGECVQGICAVPPKTKKLQAGALLLAAVASNVLVYHELGDGKAWVCAIREGIPLHGFDVVVDEKSAKETLAEVMSYVPSADIYGDIPGAKGTLDDLFAQLTPWHKKAATLIVPDNPILVLILIGVILMLAVIALFGYQYLQKRSAGNQSSMSQMQSAEDAQKIKQAFDAEVKKARQSFLYARSPSLQFALWYEILRTLPVSANGWSPATFNCDVVACQVMWRRDARALPSGAAELPGSSKNQPFNPTLKEATTSFALNTLEPVMHAESSAGADKFLLDLAVNDTLFKLTLNPSRIGVTVAPPPGAEGLVAEAIGLEGSWRATGSNPLLAPVFMQKLELPGVILNTMSIKNLNLGHPQYTIELEGRYRVRN